MDILMGFLIGFALAVTATWFPGMLNMQSVAIALRAGRRQAYIFSAGLTVVIIAQVGMTIFFAKFLKVHPDLITGIKQSAIPVFLALAVLFLIKGYRAREARKQDRELPFGKAPFWRGAGMAAMNLLNIPVFFALGGWLTTAGYLPEGFGPKAAYSLGAGAGAMSVFSTYVILAEWFHRHAALFTRNINFFISGLFVVLVIVQGVRLAS